MSTLTPPSVGKALNASVQFFLCRGKSVSLHGVQRGGMHSYRQARTTPVVHHVHGRHGMLFVCRGPILHVAEPWSASWLLLVVFLAC